MNAPRPTVARAPLSFAAIFFAIGLWLILPAQAPALAGAADDAGALGSDPAAVEAAVRTIASPFLRSSGMFILGVLAFSQILGVIRLLKGPSLADRVIVLDFLGVTAASMAGVYSVIHEDPLFLRVAIVLSLVSFVGTIGFALYCEKRGVA
ncbi:MAG: monovalent cation/H+ antiporter complex subunit F [Phycisphaerales bacterium]